VGRPEGNIKVRIFGSRWEDNIKMDVREMGWGGMDWIGLALDRD
jgi:hypothetical protein